MKYRVKDVFFGKNSPLSRLPGYTKKPTLTIDVVGLEAEFNPDDIKLGNFLYVDMQKEVGSKETFVYEVPRVMFRDDEENGEIVLTTSIGYAFRFEPLQEKTRPFLR